MASNAIDRTARALDLIPYILDRPGISIEELAVAFRTTEAEISETLNIVFMCGLPGYTPLELVDLNTDGGEVSIIDPQNLDKPRRLSQLEIISIVLGIESLKSQGLSEEVSKIANSLITKLTALLDDIRTLRLFESSGSVEKSPWRSEIERAIREKNSIEIEYAGISSDAVSTRVIAPVKLYAQGGFLYVEAISHQGDEIRNFRLDRITTLVQKEIVHREFVSTNQKSVSVDFEVQVLIPRDAVLFLEKNQTIIKSVEDVGGMRKVHFLVSQTKWLIRARASIDGEVLILHPESFAVEFNALAKSCLNGYKLS